MQITDLGTLDYRAAWAIQEQAHAEVLAGGEERLFVVEHAPVITFGRRGDLGNVVASKEFIAHQGVEIVESDRGGDVTFHGPGQVVVYPIIKLQTHQLGVGCYVHKLEDAVVGTLAEFGIATERDPAAIGVWTKTLTGDLAKICAVGVRIKRGVSLHGIALNVTTDLRYFDLIVPCGLVGRPVISMKTLMGENTPSIDRVKRVVTAKIVECVTAPVCETPRGPVASATGS